MINLVGVHATSSLLTKSRSSPAQLHPGAVGERTAANVVCEHRNEILKHRLSHESAAAVQRSLHRRVAARGHLRAFYLIVHV